ncbi:MAG: hypothetical protein M0Z52_05575 [Actinomycetota bacterium]|nr:hypothetical protein [Actinomycetota bacterium]
MPVWVVVLFENMGREEPEPVMIPGWVIRQPGFTATVEDFKGEDVKIRNT